MLLRCWMCAAPYLLSSRLGCCELPHVHQRLDDPDHRLKNNVALTSDNLFGCATPRGFLAVIRVEAFDKGQTI